MSTVRTAAVDCGTNSIRLLIADVDVSTGQATDVIRELRIVRLGEGVDAAGRFAPAALDRTLAACHEYAGLLAQAGSPPLRFVATSAARDAANRDVLIGGVQRLLGVTPEVISGVEEAALSFQGATHGLPAGLRAPYLVVDIGGGSTEFVLGTDCVDHRVSVDIGCVRMTERHLRHDPPSRDQAAAATIDIDAAIARAGAEVPFDGVGTLVGLAGSVTTVAALAMHLREYDANVLHHSRIAADDVRRISEGLLRMTVQERAEQPAMVPGREDVIGAGALILRRIVDRVGVDEVLVSEHDILDGVVHALAEDAQGTSRPE